MEFVLHYQPAINGVLLLILVIVSVLIDWRRNKKIDTVIRNQNIILADIEEGGENGLTRDTPSSG